MTDQRCGECGASIPARSSKGHTQLFCSPVPGRDCGKAYRNRRNGEGSAIILAVKAWHMTRHAKTDAERRIRAAALAEMSRIAKHYNAMDAAEGRGSAAEIFARSFGVFEGTQTRHEDRVMASAKRRATVARKASAGG